jgi:hypothetical protein
MLLTKNDISLLIAPYLTIIICLILLIRL